MIWMAIVSVYGVMSIITAGAYALDKRRAVRGGRRISEKTLHTLEFLGGWPGALIAQRIFRHKRQKTSFLLVFVCIVLLHLAGWAAIIWMLMRQT